MKKMRQAFLGLVALPLLFFSSDVWAQRRRHTTDDFQPQWTWDLGASFGTYGSYSYSEIDLGLNDHFSEYFYWRNMVWDRFGATLTSAAGVDSSVRYEFVSQGDDGYPGFRFYIGPGLRVASNNFTGDFAEAGMLFRFGGLNLGVGVKAINYFSPGKDPVTGLTLPNSDTTFMILIGGGGAL